MSVGSDSGDEDAVMSEINTTPLVDIMLVLLIIFLITSPVVLKLQKVTLPVETNQVTKTKPEDINITVNAEGEMYWNQTHIANTDRTVQVLRGAIGQGATTCSESSRRPGNTLRIDRSGDLHGTACWGTEGRFHHRTAGQGLIGLPACQSPARVPERPSGHRPRCPQHLKGNTMGMNIGSGSAKGADPEPMMEMNMTPLIDVLLVLIIMMIITIPRQNHSVNLNMPVGTPPPQTEKPQVVTIDVDFDGTILWDGQAIPDRPSLEAKMNSIAAMPNQPEVHLRPNKLVEYKVVAGVMATAQRLGVTKIGMVGNEQFQ
jgi:biopolymer transport protein ExbD